MPSIIIFLDVKGALASRTFLLANKCKKRSEAAGLQGAHSLPTVSVLGVLYGMAAHESHGKSSLQKQSGFSSQDAAEGLVKKWWG